MIKVSNVKVYNFENAIIGMRNPMNSWDKSDSQGDILGKEDIKLAQKLIHAGSPNDKFLRQMLCSMQITAPIYWWKEMDTYKVATVANSTSTMHKIHSKPFELSDFSFDDNPIFKNTEENILKMLEELRQLYLSTRNQQNVDNPYWRALIQLLPESYNQTRMWTANYSTLREIYKWRQDHKLSEWRDFCKEILKLPYASELIAFEFL